MDRNNAVQVVIVVVYTVALRKESVDRNRQRDQWKPIQAKSLSARRAWIEIRVPSSTVIVILRVALRKESVDRN